MKRSLQNRPAASDWIGRVVVGVLVVGPTVVSTDVATVVVETNVLGGEVTLLAVGATDVEAIVEGVGEAGVGVGIGAGVV